MGFPGDGGDGRGKGEAANSKLLIRVLFPERRQCWEIVWTESKEIAKLEFRQLRAMVLSRN